MNKNKIFMACLRTYKNAYDRYMLEAKPMKKSHIYDEIVGMVRIIASIFDLAEDVIRPCLDRCRLTWDGTTDLYIIPVDVQELFKLEI